MKTLAVAAGLLALTALTGRGLWREKPGRKPQQPESHHSCLKTEI